MTNRPKQSPQELDLAISNARQGLSLLRSHAKAGHFEPTYFEQRLSEIASLFDELVEVHKQSSQQERYAKLYEVSRVIGSSLDLQVVLDQVMDAIIELTDAERGFLMLLDDDGKLKVRVARNFDQETLQSSEFTMSNTVTNRVLETGIAIVTTNAQEDPRFAGQQSIVTNALRSIMASPLRVRGNIIGVVYVDNRVRAGLFSPSDLDILDAFAGQAAVAIDNARLFAATDDALAARVEELTTLQRIDRQLNETLNSQRVLEIALGAVGQVSQTPEATMALIDPNGFVVRAASYKSGQEGFGTEAAIPLDTTLVKQVIEKKEAALQTAQDDQSALLMVPINRENRVIGVISLQGMQDSLGNDTRNMITRIADRAAISIENAHLYDAVQAANNAKSEFVSLVAHELKVPMTSITGYADLLGMGGTLNERQTQFVGTIKNAVRKMTILVNDLNDISRIETGHMRINIDKISVIEAINSTLESTSHEIEQRGHKLDVDVDPDLPPVNADKDRLIQVLLNLLSNAYKYTRDNGQITISAKRKDNTVVISVKDSGVGMSAEQVAKLGTKFWRADNGLQQSGTGLGFAITRNLIELMKGKLTIESVPDIGSTFSFTLPIAL